MEESTTSRKRKSDMQGSSPKTSKVPKLEIDKEEDPAKLRYMNKSLAVDIQDKNNKIQELTRKCKALYKARNVADSAYRCIRRQWTQLIEDIKTIVESLPVQNSSSSDSEQRFGHLLSSIEPFASLDVNARLQLVLPDWYLVEPEVDDNEKHDPPPTEAQGVEESLPPTVEKAVVEECQRVNEIIQHLVNVLKQLGKDRGLTFNSDSQAAVALGEKMRVLQSQLRSTQDKVQVTERHLKEVERDLELKERERHRASRDLERFRQNYDGKGGELPKPEETTKPEITTNSEESKVAELEKKCIELEKQLSAQTQVKAQEALAESTKAEILKLQEEIGFQKALITRVRSLHEQAQKETEMYKAERNQVMEDSEKNAAKIQAHWVEEMKQSQKEAADAKTHTNELNAEITQLKNQLQLQEDYKKQLEDQIDLCTSLQSAQQALNTKYQRAEEKGKRAQRHKTQAQMDVLNAKVKSLENEKAELREKLSEMRQQLSASADEKTKLFSKENTDLQKELGEARSRVSRRDIAVANLTAEVEEQKRRNEEAGAEAESLIGEIEALSKEFDALQGQNSSLLKQMKKVSEDKSVVESENLLLTNSKNNSSEEMSALREQMSAMTQSASTLEELNTKSKQAHGAAVAEITALHEQLRQLTREIEVNRTDLRKFKNDATVAKQQAEELAAKIKPCEVCTEREKTEAERRRSMKDARDSLSGEPMSEIQQFELKNLRRLVNCSVCQDRQKKVIITKCFHMFCKECIDNNLKARNRKCPTCKKMFGQDDVKAVWVD